MHQLICTKNAEETKMVTNMYERRNKRGAKKAKVRSQYERRCDEKKAMKEENSNADVILKIYQLLCVRISEPAKPIMG